MLALILFISASVAGYILIPVIWISFLPSVFFLAFLLFIMHFFRLANNRKVPESFSETLCVSPCDGKVVAIETITEKEYFNNQRIQVSIFMSPLNIHINWYPIKGQIVYSKYYKGKHLVAWEPKSSELNERTTIVVKNEKGHEVLFRQVAGKVARRVISYANEGKSCNAGNECGFIKFGSRVDVILPIDSEIKVKIGQKVQGMSDVIANL